MSKFEKIAIALLAAIAVEGAVTTAEVVRMAEEGFSVELTREEADVDEAVRAKEAAEADM